MRYVATDEVLKVEEKFRQDHTRGVGADAVFETVSLGWFVQLRGSPASFGVGGVRPQLIPGDRVRLTVEKTT